MTDRQQCQSCSAPATLWICPRCSQEMAAQLRSLAYGPKVNGHSTAGLLDALEDVELKRTKLSADSGHRQKGDERPDPYEPDTEKSKQTAQGRASTLLHMVRNTLSTIIRDLCESRGVTDPAIVTTSNMAKWLAHNANAIACDEAAGQWRAEIDKLVRSIELAIDRPDPPRFCGPCPTYIESRRDNCGRLLYARRDKPEVRCSACKATHHVATMVDRLENRADTMRFTAPEILTIMVTLGTPIPERTWQRWRKDVRVRPRGFKRPDNDDGTRGRVGDHRKSEDDEPVYRLSEVRAAYRNSIRHSDAKIRQKARV